MTTIDTRDLEAVSGGTFDRKAATDPAPRPLGGLPKQQLPHLPGDIPLGPYYPPSTRPDIA